MTNNNPDRTEVIWKVLLELGKHDAADTALTEAMQVICDEVRAAEMTFWMLDEEQNRITAVAHVGEHSVVGCSIEPEDSLAGEALQTGSDIWIPDPADSRYFTNGIDAVTGIRIQNCFVSAAKRGRKTVGCLQVINHPAGEYTDTEKNILHSFCGLAVMAAEEKGFTFPGRKERKAILSLQNITKEYPLGSGTLKVLKGINLEIYENEFLVILGESGCGKSTLLNILGGMDSPTGGTMTVDGRDFSRPSEDDLTQYRRDIIGFVFQFYNLMPNLTALENIEFVAENTPVHGDSAEVLAMVGLADHADSYPSMLSGGQQQRISIARAIVKRPRIILADEPTGALDFTTGQEVLRVIEKLVREEKTTVVMVTHNAEIARMASRVIRLRDGKISSIQENPWPCTADELVW